jgi:hypothetical protein
MSTTEGEPDMGHMQAIDMAEQAPDLNTLLEWHLRYNHYPPVPLAMMEPCHEAMDAILADEPDAQVALPDGVLYKGSGFAPAWAIADNYHLHDLIEQQGGY